MEDRCVACGEVIPEGRQVCPMCEKGKQNMANESPCVTCTRVKDPENCENKSCQVWREWFIRRWEEIRSGK